MIIPFPDAIYNPPHATLGADHDDLRGIMHKCQSWAPCAARSYDVALIPGKTREVCRSEKNPDGKQPSGITATYCNREGEGAYPVYPVPPGVPRYLWANPDLWEGRAL